MRDILAGGDLQLASAASAPLKFARQRPRRQPSQGKRPARAAAKVSIQPGQLASPRITGGFMSLALH